MILDQRLRRTQAPIHVFGPKMVFTDDVLAISKRAQGERRVSPSDINAYAARSRTPTALRATSG